MALPPDGPVVKRRENIRQLWGSVVQQIGLKAVRLDTLDLEVAGDTAYEVSEAVLTLEGGSAVVSAWTVGLTIGIDDGSSELRGRWPVRDRP